MGWWGKAVLFPERLYGIIEPGLGNICLRKQADCLKKCKENR